VIVSGVGGLASEVRHEIDPYALNLMYHEVANAVGIEPAPLDMLSEAAGLQEVTAAAYCCSCRSYANCRVLQEQGAYDLSAEDPNTVDEDEWSEVTTSDEDIPEDPSDEVGAASEEEGEGAESLAEPVDEWEGAMMQGDKIVLVGPASDYAVGEDIYTGPTDAPSEQLDEDLDAALLDWIKG
jgi:hypothetical protein